MRGKANTLSAGDEPIGIIPAGAGKRYPLAEAMVLTQDHPRGCGEKYNTRLDCESWRGSSPRVRGKGLCVNGKPRNKRIIPAGAGKRWPLRRLYPLVWDHPRGCGEKTTRTRKGPKVRGSSPRVRGKVIAPRVNILADGIIPAGAGKSKAWIFGILAKRDHPRGCGEKVSSVDEV